MSSIEKPVSDFQVAREALHDSIDELGDVVQDLEARLDQLVVPICREELKCVGDAPAPPRSKITEEIYVRVAHIQRFTDRLRGLRNNIDL